MSSNYSHITNNSNPQANRGGYKDVFYFAPVADFLSMATPVGTGLGGTRSITSAHTFTSPKGFWSWETKSQSVTVKSATVGDPGAQLMEHTAEFVVLGDSASTQEQMERQLNAKCICLVKDANCLIATQYVQLGDECTQPVFSVAFDGKTTAGGMKEYTVTVKVVASKYFYTGTVTQNSATS